MTTQVIMIISEDEKDSKVQAQANETTATINIFAKTLEEAKSMLPEGEALLQEAIESAETGVEDPGRLTHTYIAPISEEEALAKMQDYEDSEDGGKFVKRIKKAFDFATKTDKTGFFNLWEYRYFALMAWAKDPHEAIVKSYAYGYQKGYKKGQKTEKEKAGR